MTLRKSLVRIGGKTVQLPVGDTVAGVDNTKLPLAGGQMTGPFNEAYGSASISGTTLVWGANGNAAFVSGLSTDQIAFMFDPSVTVSGAVRRITFVSPSITLVHSNNLYLPTQANIVVKNGDSAIFQADSPNAWRCIAYTRVDGTALASSSTGPANTDALPEGATNKYFTAARVLATVLNGLSLLTGSAVTSADSVLVAIGKLQAQSTAQDAAISGKEPTITGTNAAQYWNGAKAFVDFATSVRGAVLTGLSLATSSPVAATDTTLMAFGKLQAQITALGGAFRVENVAATTIGQTSFPIPNGYTAGAIMVFLKGVLQAPADYTASDGVNVVLAVGADAAGDILSVGVVGAVRAQDDALLSYTVAGLPSASANTAKLRYCTNMAGGAGPVFSNGTNWLRVADNTVVTT